ncbi:hypothetical protein Ciccas_003755 [Cichlidogyrus casuarinus]|uniref:Uncharacterized protein n=1 Tax=Cichlidogyrus casuarinus TaxID=1844966 RepID=A0ABD2QFQ7_9PLAT
MGPSIDINSAFLDTISVSMILLRLLCLLSFLLLHCVLASDPPPPPDPDIPDPQPQSEGPPNPPMGGAPPPFSMPMPPPPVRVPPSTMIPGSRMLLMLAIAHLLIRQTVFLRRRLNFRLFYMLHTCYHPIHKFALLPLQLSSIDFTAYLKGFVPFL